MNFLVDAIKAVEDTVKAVERAVNATEVTPAPKKKPAGVSPKKKSVTAAVAPSAVTATTRPRATKTPLIVHLQTKGKPVIFRINAIVIVLVTWCAIFWLAPPTLTLTDLTNAQRIELLRSRTQVLSLLTMAFAKPVSSEVALVLSMVFVPVRLQTDAKSWLSRLVFVASILGAYLVTLPFSSLSYQQQPDIIVPRIAYKDLSQYYQSALRAASNETQYATCSQYVYCWGEVRGATMLYLSMYPPRVKEPVCTVYPTQKSNGYTNVAYGFKRNDWDYSVLGVAPVNDNAYNVPGLLDKAGDVVQNNMTLAEAQQFEEYFTRCMYLYLDALAYQEAARGGSNVALLQKHKLLTIDYFKANAISGTLNSITPVGHLTKYIRTYFDTTKEWANAVGVNYPFGRIYSSTHTLSKGITFVGLTLDLPMANGRWHRKLAEVNGTLVQLNTTWSGTGNVEYEIDVANECGPKTCGMENRRLAPEPQISAYGVCQKAQPDCARYMSDTSMWLFGVGRRMLGKEFRLFNQTKPPTLPTLRKAVVVNPFLYHRVTFGLLSFELVDLAKKFNAECTASASEGGCMGLNFPIVGSGDQVVVGVKSMPMADYGHGFDLLNNLARARPLVTRYTTGALIDYEILRPANFEVYSWSDTLDGYECSGKMERSISDTEFNYMYMESTIQPVYTAGVALLLQYGRRYSNVSTSRGWSLQFKSNEYQAFAKLEIPDWQAVLGFIIGGLLAAGVVFLMRVKWEQTVTHPDALMRVLADAAAYPDAYLDVVAANGSGDNLRLAPVKSITFTRADGGGHLVFKDS